MCFILFPSQQHSHNLQYIELQHVHLASKNTCAAVKGVVVTSTSGSSEGQ